jgi:hypothetical protein
MSDMLWACAMLEEQPSKQWMDGLLAASKQLLPSFPPHALATMLWALALMQHRPPADWLERCMPAIDALLGPPPQAAPEDADADTDAAAAASGSAPPRPPAFDTAALPRVAWALAALGVGPPRPTLERLVARCAGDVGALCGDAVAELVWALERLDGVPGRPLIAVVTTAARRALLGARSGASGSGDNGAQRGAGAPAAAPVAPQPAAADLPARGGARKGAVTGRTLLARPAWRYPAPSRR